MISRVHHCTGQINVAEERNEPPAPNCRCRKFISIEEATAMVDGREASWVVIKRTRVLAQVICKLCAGDKSVKNCAGCSGKGLAPEPVVWDEYNNDIVLVSQMPEDKTEKKRSSVLKKMTPRVATIESEHIERAYVYGKKEAAARIEEYGLMILEARAFVGKDKTYVIGVEPEDNPKTGEGRRYDYGRAVFSTAHNVAKGYDQSASARIAVGGYIMKLDGNS